jgi:hypothetical protein
MTDLGLGSPHDAPQGTRWIASPYLHLYDHAVINPHTGRGIGSDHPWFPTLEGLIRTGRVLDALDDVTLGLAGDLWLIPETTDLSHHYRLRWVSLEAHTVCNQRCYFCPVSVAPRDAEYMPTELYERIVHQIAELDEPIEAVAMIQYNEPTADRRFLDQVRTIKDAGLPPAVLSNGTGLTPDRVDALVAMGGLSFLSVNLSTLDRERYAAERGRDHLDRVISNLDYAKDKAVADTMVIVVLGTDPEIHARDYAAIQAHFEGSRFIVQDYEANDRAAYLGVGLTAQRDGTRLVGCDYGGSRPIEHLHITAQARVVLCCQDYTEGTALGDLKTQSVREVLESDDYARARRQVYGLESAPDAFICANCSYALRR